jgi:hypothetical protein
MGTVVGIDTSFENIGDRERFTITQARDAFMGFRVSGLNFPAEMMRPEGMMFMPSQREVEAICVASHQACAAGRMIDFGDLPNAVIMATSKRAGPLYNQRLLGHPFRDPWIFFHTWEMSSSVYLVMPTEHGPQLGGEVEVVELQGLTLLGKFFLAIGDRALLSAYDPDHAEQRVDKFHATPAPSLWRFVSTITPDLDARINKGNPFLTAIENVLDPLMTALMILNTRNVERRTERVSEKLQKARKKNGKPPIPPYDIVSAAPYVTALMTRGQRSGARSEDHGGTHRSPHPHLRIGHPRTYAPGQVTFIRDTLVNVNDQTRDAFHRTRSHYEVKR